MKTFAAILMLVFVAVGRLAPAQEPGGDPVVAVPAAGAPRFLVVDVMLDAGAESLAAYQVEVSSAAGGVKIVGIEGGEPAAFRNAPYYDPSAMQHERVVLGAYSTAPVDQLPRGVVRVASVHCLMAGDTKPVFNAKVSAAAAAGGRPISVQINVKERSGR